MKVMLQKAEEMEQALLSRQTRSVLDNVHCLTSMRPPKLVNLESRLGIKPIGDVVMGVMQFSVYLITHSASVIYVACTYPLMETIPAQSKLTNLVVLL